MKISRVLFLAATLILLTAGGAMAQNEEGELDWPRKITGEKGEVVIYQPQVESFVGDKLESRSAISLKEAGQEGMIFGAMWFESRLATDMETRTATLVRTKVTAAKFPEVEQGKVEELSRFLEKEIPTWDITISLDRLLASLPDHQGEKENYGSDAPRIYHRTAPTVLVSIDGDPILTDLTGFDLEYVANSAFFIVKDKRNGFYLRGSGMWFVSDDIGGVWKRTDDLPGEVAKVSRKIDEEEQAQADEQKDDAAALEREADADEPDPEIIVTTVPAELIITDGEPDFATIKDTQLLYLKNTENDVLMDIAGQQYYALFAGRWYRTASLSDETWEFVSFEDLPVDFEKIPAGSDMGGVLGSVPGTVESREAILETQIPQTAEIDRKTATVEVTYDGDPEFEACGEGVAYALNTDKSVLLIDQVYYCVDNAVWFVGNGPSGPWRVATEVPAVVQDLPPDCPVYNVKYVYIYDSTPEVVYVGYTSGYYGSYVWGPCVVYGTGWYYRPWWGAYYYPRPVTYGFGVHYSPYSGWGFSFGVSYGWLSIGMGWGRPHYGYWGAGGYRYGYRAGYWHGYNRGYRHGYNRGAAAGYRAGYRAGQRQPRNNAYRNRSNGVKRTGDVRRRDGKRPAPAGRDRKNNVYADRHGDIYRDRDGNWEKREDGKWARDREGDRDRQERDRQERDRQERDRKERDRTERDRQQKIERDRVERDRADRDRRQQMDRDRSDRDRRQQMDRDRSSRDRRQQLDRDRSSRNRGSQRQRQSPSRGGGARRGGGGRRR
ncbi:MAG: hypothetical protein ABFS42_10620 [Candidatus Krumholzibacteriota bacterium]